MGRTAGRNGEAGRFLAWFWSRRSSPGWHWTRPERTNLLGFGLWQRTSAALAAAKRRSVRQADRETSTWARHPDLIACAHRRLFPAQNHRRGWPHLQQRRSHNAVARPVSRRLAVHVPLEETPIKIVSLSPRLTIFSCVSGVTSPFCKQGYWLCFHSHWIPARSQPYMHWVRWTKLSGEEKTGSKRLSFPL